MNKIVYMVIAHNCSSDGFSSQTTQGPLFNSEADAEAWINKQDASYRIWHIFKSVKTIHIGPSSPWPLDPRLFYMMQG